VILHEDKKYYPSAAEIYGEDVEALVQEEDAQPLSEPIVAPVKVRKWMVEEKGLPETRFDKGCVPTVSGNCLSTFTSRFLVDMTNHPEMIRNIAIVGHLHHGKSSLVDMLVFETHKMTWDADTPVCKTRVAVSWLTIHQLRYTDVHALSREREISIKCSPISLVLPTTAGKSHLLHLVDTPGHVNFVDEVASSIRLVDGVIIVVDVVEGVRVNQATDYPLLTASLDNGKHREHHSTCTVSGSGDYIGC
jgi:116 kDa U5 small nuclear ribonucleoprotein component